MSNPGLYFLILDLTESETKVLLDLGLKSFVIQALKNSLHEISKNKNSYFVVFG